MLASFVHRVRVPCRVITLKQSALMVAWGWGLGVHGGPELHIHVSTNLVSRSSAQTQGTVVTCRERELACKDVGMWLSVGAVVPRL